MLVEHPNFGQLLRRARKRKDSFGLGFGCRVYRVWGGGGGGCGYNQRREQVVVV